jgi:hypothetical protein
MPTIKITVELCGVNDKDTKEVHVIEKSFVGDFGNVFGATIGQVIIDSMYPPRHLLSDIIDGLIVEVGGNSKEADAWFNPYWELNAALEKAYAANTRDEDLDSLNDLIASWEPAGDEEQVA